ncbi:MAG: hypothetical protein RSC73_00990 [Ruthenibacterium sp.]
MYTVSENYRTLMQKTVRPTARVRLRFGMIDDGAAEDAVLSAAAQAWLSALAAVPQNTGQTALYATFEQERFALDGTQLLCPENKMLLRPCGFVSDAVSGADGGFAAAPVIRIDFSIPRTMVGLTLDFGAACDVPSAFTVLSYRGSTKLAQQRVTNGITATLPKEFLLEEIDRIDIQFDKTLRPYGRARLFALTFGIGYLFTGKDVLTVDERHSADPLCAVLPNGEMRFSLYNNDKRYNVDSDTALVRFLADGQRVDVQYGMDVAGGTEWIPSLCWTLNGWSVEGIHADFKAVDEIYRLNQTLYERAPASLIPRSAYDVLTDIFKSGGTADYYIADYLKQCFVKNPVPLVSHAAAAQLVAGLHGAQLYCDRTGRVVVDMLFRKPILTALAMEPAGASVPYSDAASTLLPAQTPYASFENTVFRMDGMQNLLGTSAVKTGFISKTVSDANGMFASDTGVRYTFDNKTRIANITLDFGLCIPHSIAIVSDTARRIFAPRQSRERFAVNFERTGQVKILFLQMEKAGQRAHLAHVGVDGVYNFILCERDIYGDAKGELAPRVRNVILATTQYAASAQRTEIFKGSVPAGEWVRIEHSGDPVLNMAAAASIGTPELRSAAYVSYVRVRGAVGSVSLVLTGEKVTKTEGSISFAVHATGEDLALTNPLVRSDDAQTLGATAVAYVSNREKYTLETRGFPEMESMDVFDLIEESRNYCLLQHDLAFNGALRSNLVMRRCIGYAVD